MGTSNSVSSRVSRYRRESGSSDDEWNTLKVLECVDWCFSFLSASSIGFLSGSNGIIATVQKEARQKAFLRMGRYPCPRIKRYRIANRYLWPLAIPLIL